MMKIALHVRYSCPFVLAAATTACMTPHAGAQGIPGADPAVLTGASSEPAPAGTAGRDDRGFFLREADTRLTLGGLIQTRYLLNSRDDAGDNQDITSGFIIRRIRGYVRTQLTKELSAFVQVGTTTPGEFQLLIADATWKFDDAWSLRGGQFKLPMLKEELNTDTRLLTADRSTVNAVFTQDYSQGVELRYDSADVRWWGAISDGLRTINTDVESNREADVALTTRAEFRLAGAWSQYETQTSWRGQEYGAFAGIAGHWQSGGETNATPDRDVTQLTVDTGSRGDGWNTTLQGVLRWTDDGALGQDFLDAGYFVQGGYFVSEQTELFARWSHILPDGDRSAGQDFRDVTVGVNYYVIPESHAAKLTADVLWFLDDQAGSSSVVGTSSANGLLASDEDQQVVLRVQMQVLF